MNQNLINRLQPSAPHLLETLSEKLSLTDLQSLLMAVYEKRVLKLLAKKLLDQYQQNRFIKPAAIDPLKIIRFDLFAFSNLPKTLLAKNIF